MLANPEKVAEDRSPFRRCDDTGRTRRTEAARDRIRSKLKSLQGVEPPIELRVSVHNPWSRNLLVALLRRYDIEPYRQHGQKRTTVMAKIPKTFAEQTLISEFESLNEVLVAHLSELAERIISEAIFNNNRKK